MSDPDKRATQHSTIHTDMERRRIALSAALQLHGANALAVDVIETACEFYAWLALPSKVINAAGAPALAALRTPK